MGKNVPAVISRSMQEQGINASAINLILPTQTFGDVIGKYDRVTMEVVQVDPDPKNGEVYALEGKLQFGKTPLQKMASALGIVWDPSNTGIVESTEWKSRAKATGAIRKPNGEWLPTTEEKTIDVSVDVKSYQLKYEEDADKGNFTGKVTEWGTSKSGKKFPAKFEPWKSDEERERIINRAVRKAVLQRLKFKDELALTGAKDRVIRYFLALKNGYTAAELSKPIAFPRISTDTNKMLEDPAMRQLAIGRMNGAVGAIFGGENTAAYPEEPKAIEAPAEQPPAPEPEQPTVPDAVWGKDSGEEMSERDLKISTLEGYLNSDVLPEAGIRQVRIAVENPQGYSDADLDELLRKCRISAGEEGGAA